MTSTTSSSIFESQTGPPRTSRRLVRDKRSRAYVARCTAEGRTKKEIIRCLKPQITRGVYSPRSSWLAGNRSRVRV
jgi:hypothetical protein